MTPPRRIVVRETTVWYSCDESMIEMPAVLLRREYPPLTLHKPVLRFVYTSVAILLRP